MAKDAEHCRNNIFLSARVSVLHVLLDMTRQSDSGVIVPRNLEHLEALFTSHHK